MPQPIPALLAYAPHLGFSTDSPGDDVDPAVAERLAVSRATGGSVGIASSLASMGETTQDLFATLEHPVAARARVVAHAAARSHGMQSGAGVLAAGAVKVQRQGENLEGFYVGGGYHAGVTQYDPIGSLAGWGSCGLFYLSTRDDGPGVNLGMRIGAGRNLDASNGVTALLEVRGDSSYWGFAALAGLENGWVMRDVEGKLRTPSLHLGSTRYWLWVNARHKGRQLSQNYEAIKELAIGASAAVAVGARSAGYAPEVRFDIVGSHAERAREDAQQPHGKATLLDPGAGLRLSYSW